MLNKEDTARRDALIKKEGYKLPNGDRIVIKDGQITWVKACGFLTVERPAYGAEQVLWDLLRATLGNVAPDEPVFVLKGRDPQAPSLLKLWARRRERLAETLDGYGESRDASEKAESAYRIAHQMEGFKRERPELGVPAHEAVVGVAEARAQVEDLITQFAKLGLITRVDLVPQRPLAMSNYQMVVDVRTRLTRPN